MLTMIPSPRMIRIQIGQGLLKTRELNGFGRFLPENRFPLFLRAI